MSASPPWSGKSDAISTSGFVPPDSTCVHAGGNVPARVPPATLTQAEPAPTASACVASSRTLRDTAFVRASTRASTPSRKSPVHTAPSP